jgi:NCAIR mutase (PurE)-related protein
VLATRIRQESIDPLKALLPAADIDPTGRTATLGRISESRGTVAVVTAGTSDSAVAAEAATTLKVFGVGADRISDVGVAGIHRVLDQRERLMDADVVIVVAGMEGALASVVGGLIGLPVIAVPTSIGYGTSFNGLTALLGMLNSCAPGVVVTNIDNGFGAAVHAARIVRQMGRGLRV